MVKLNYITTSSGLVSLGAKKEGDYEMVYGKTHKYDNGFFVTEVYFSHQSRKMLFNWIRKTNDNKILDSFSWQMILI